MVASFKEFLTEKKSTRQTIDITLDSGDDIYSVYPFTATQGLIWHGSQTLFDTPIRNLHRMRNIANFGFNDISVIIGAHFARDPNISKYFARITSWGDRKSYLTSYKLPSNIKLVPSITAHDDANIASFVFNTIRENSPHFFPDEFHHKKVKNFLDAENLYYDSVNQQTIKRFDRRFLLSCGVEFLRIMKEKGIDGLSYHNTASNEIRNSTDSLCYVIFFPEKLTVMNTYKYILRRGGE